MKLTKIKSMDVNKSDEKNEIDVAKEAVVNVDLTQAGVYADIQANHEAANAVLKDRQEEANEYIKSREEAKARYGATVAPNSPEMKVNEEDDKLETKGTVTVKPIQESISVKDRKELAALITEARAKGINYKVSKSLQEGFRYVFESWKDEEDVKDNIDANCEVCPKCGKVKCECEEAKEEHIEECNKIEECSEIKEEVINEGSVFDKLMKAAEALPESINESKGDFEKLMRAAQSLGESKKLKEGVETLEDAVKDSLQHFEELGKEPSVGEVLDDVANNYAGFENICDDPNICADNYDKVKEIMSKVGAPVVEALEEEPIDECSKKLNENEIEYKGFIIHQNQPSDLANGVAGEYTFELNGEPTYCSFIEDCKDIIDSELEDGSGTDSWASLYANYIDNNVIAEEPKQEEVITNWEDDVEPVEYDTIDNVEEPVYDDDDVAIEKEEKVEEKIEESSATFNKLMKAAQALKEEKIEESSDDNLPSKVRQAYEEIVKVLGPRKPHTPLVLDEDDIAVKVFHRNSFDDLDYEYQEKAILRYLYKRDNDGPIYDSTGKEIKLEESSAFQKLMAAAKGEVTECNESLKEAEEEEKDEEPSEIVNDKAIDAIKDEINPMDVIPQEDQEEAIPAVVDPDMEIDVDTLDSYEPTGDEEKATFSTIKDAGEGVMYAFKDTLKDLNGLKIKLSDLQTLLSSGSAFLLDLLGLGPKEDENEILPEVEAPVTIVDSTPVDITDQVKSDVESGDIPDELLNTNGFEEVEPVDVDEEEVNK